MYMYRQVILIMSKQVLEKNSHLREKKNLMMRLQGIPPPPNGAQCSVYFQAGAAKPVLSQFSSLVSAASKQPASVHSMAATRIIVGIFMIYFLILHHTVRPRSHFCTFTFSGCSSTVLPIKNMQEEYAYMFLKTRTHGLKLLCSGCRRSFIGNSSASPVSFQGEMKRGSARRSGQGKWQKKYQQTRVHTYS
jgi:hypothetical protein